MSTDRYLKAILTIIAIELGWIGLSHTAIPVAAQANATPVIIRGIEVPESNALPVAVVGSTRQIPGALLGRMEPLTVHIESETPLKIDAPVPLRVQVIAPVKVETDRALKVEQVPYT